MKILLFFLISTLSGLSAQAGCFEKHLTDAISINQARKPLYSALSGGKSEKISDALMDLEKRMLFYQKFINYDKWSQPYEDRGIPVSCNAVVSMNNVPPFMGTFSNGAVPPEARVSQAQLEDLPRLTIALENSDQSVFLNLTQKILARLKKEPRLDCLYRHFLQSMARISAIQSTEDEAAAAVGLQSPRRIYHQMLIGHLAMLPTVLHIDSEAQDLNASGLSIICGDVPPIPLGI